MTKLSDIVAPHFFPTYKELKKDNISECWLRGGRGCFSGEQRIRTTRGPVPIQDVQIGDRVYTVNEETSRIEVKPVIDTFAYENVKETFEVILRNGQRIVATGDHKFFQVGGCVSLKQLLQSIHERTVETDTGVFEVRGFNRRQTSVDELQSQRRSERVSEGIEALTEREGRVSSDDAQGRFGEVSNLESSQVGGDHVSGAGSGARVGGQSQEWGQDRQPRRKSGVGDSIREHNPCSKDRASSSKARGGLELFKTDERSGDRDTQDSEGTREVLQQEAACGTVRGDGKLYQGCGCTPKELLGRLLNVGDIVSYREVEVAKVYDLSVQDNHNYMLDIGDGVLVHNSTKSSFISLFLVLGIVRNPNANAIVFRRFENEIHDSVFNQILWAISMLGLGEQFDSFKRPHKVVYKPTGQIILFKAADKPLKVKSIKIPVGYIKFVWFEEVDQFAGMEQIRNLQQSLLRGTTEQQTVFYSYNPPKSARSWVNKETKQSKPGRIVHYSDYRTVPEDWLGETFLTEAEHLKIVNPEAYRHEYLGEETGTGLEVFTNVDVRPITDSEIAYFDHRNQGLDFGYAADPLCFIEGHYDAKKKRLYLFDEVAGIGMKNSHLVQKLSPDQLAELTLADAAEPKSIDELRQDHGMNIMAAEKAPGSVDYGIKYLQDLEQIIIDPVRCPLAATEFINYSLDVDRYGETISKYPDKNNHSIDAVRYMMDLHIRQNRKERRKKKKARAMPIMNRWGR